MPEQSLSTPRVSLPTKIPVRIWRLEGPGYSLLVEFAKAPDLLTLMAPESRLGILNGIASYDLPIENVIISCLGVGLGI